MANITFRLKGMESKIFTFAKSKPAFRQTLRDFFSSAALTATETFKEKTPLGHTGLLRAGWKFDYNTDGMRVYNKVEYGEAVNYGRKSGGVSRAGQKSILDWVRKSAKGQSFASGFKAKNKSERDKKAAKSLIWKITKKGIEGQKFFEKSLRGLRPKIKKDFNALRFEIIRRLVNE